MQTRCLSCGNPLTGVAQFCEACAAKQRTPEPVPDTAPVRIPPPAPRQQTSSAYAINIAFFAAVGLGVVAVAAWILAFGGAESIGLSGDDSQQATLPQVTQAAVTAELGFAASDCKFEIPEGATIECGQLTVPQSRAQPDGPRAALPVAIFRSTSPTKRPDPIVYLDGGPGGNTLQAAPSMYEAMGPLVEDRDLILFDQRGAGFSEPSLDCPEVTQINYDHLERSLEVDQRAEQLASSVKTCRERLRNLGVNPSFATSAENAADVNDLRLALGYSEWNLFGVSYGTKLALTVMRDFPQGVRSVILDSTYPPQADLYIEKAADFHRALKVMFDACAADVACAQTYPGLEQAFNETVTRLNEQPVLVPLGTFTGRSLEGALIDGVWFSSFIFSALYSEQLTALLPRAIFDTRDHKYEILNILADAYLQDAEFVSIGMHYSVQCGEEAAFTNRDSALAAAADYPELAEFNQYQAKSTFAACDAWGAPPAAARENEPVASDIPTLVLAGHYDPITPPAWGQQAAAGLTNHFFFEFPGLGHGVALSDSCPKGVTVDFLNNPGQSPPSGCIADMPSIEWLVE